MIIKSLAKTVFPLVRQSPIHTTLFHHFSNTHQGTEGTTQDQTSNSLHQMIELSNKSPQTSTDANAKEKEKVVETVSPASAMKAKANKKEEKLAEMQILISDRTLSLCSPLMRKILSNSTTKEVKISAQQALKVEEESQIATQNKHDLHNFRHMLAGPILSEANLDKFCIKGKTPLVVDVKYDGERTMISFERGEELEMISRNGKTQDEFYSKLHQTIQQQLEQTDIQSIKLDGEIVAVNKHTLVPLPLGDLLKQKKIKNPQSLSEESDTVLLVYIFDVLQKNGVDLLTTKLIQRRKLIPEIDIFKPAEHRIIHFPEERAKIFEFFREALERKYEGLIIKGSNDLYFTNESRSHWKKLKRGFANNRDSKISKIELDLIVMGANRGQGSKNSKSFTSYLLGTQYNGKIIPVSNVGSGLTEEMIAIISKHISETSLRVDKVPEEYELGGAKADVYFKPSLVFQVHAQQLTVSPLYKLGAGEFGGLSLRFPVFKGIRTDKGVQQATKGLEILQLSKSFNFNLPA